MSQAYIFSLVFFSAFAVYFVFGLYILSLNTKSALNRLFFASCLALAVWAFCFSMANISSDYESALYWRRCSSLGWGTVYSLMLHFFLVLTERKELLKRKYFYLALYVPAILNVYYFGFNDSARAQYNLLQTPNGWINTSTGGLGDIYFNAYYILFTLTGLIVVWLWGKRAVDKIKKKQATLFIATFSIAMVLGSLTDVIVNTYIAFKVPQMAPIFILLPILAMFYAIKRYGLMKTAENENSEPGKILNQDNMGKFIAIMSFVYVVGGLLNFFARFYLNPSPPSLIAIMPISAFFFAIGTALVFLKSSYMNNNFREQIFILIMLISVLYIAIYFTDTASITVWATPFIIVMLSVLFNKRYLILWIGAFILATQLYIWIKIPIVTVQVDGSDYFTRIVIFGITLGLAYFVNHVYVKRLQENEDQVRFQMLISRISSEFVKVSELNLSEKIQEMLELSGQHLKVDRTFFIRMNENQNAYAWCNEGIEPATESIPRLSEETVPWWMKEMAATDLVDIESAESLPSEAAAERELLKSHGIKSVATIAVKNKGKLLGFLIFASMKNGTAFGKSHQELLRILANILSDALVKVDSELEIRYMAYYDALTGLPNHTLFKDRLGQAILLASRTQTPLGVVFLDLDEFKTVNDSIGHLGGDEMLQIVASRLSLCLRKCDTVSRFGGDEFLIILTGMQDIDKIRHIAEKIIHTIAQPILINEQELFVTASIGISVYPADGESGDELIKNADLAMFAAKEMGKNQFALCTPVMKEDVSRKMMLTNSLYRALEKNELLLHYQPQINADTQNIVGMEALLRWNSQEFGMIPPGVFIPLAEQTGLIIPIGKWVFETACRQVKVWQEMGLPTLRLAINLSVDQFRDRDFTTMIQSILSETGFNPKNLELEITESIAIEGKDNIVGVLKWLQALGVSISIDDFGIEYSSLNRLKSLPVDRIKIDMQFVHGINSGTKDKAIAKTIIQLAKNLELNVIAEGVEKEEQYVFFRDNMCDEIQGYFFYKPLPADALESILRDQMSIQEI